MHVSFGHSVRLCGLESLRIIVGNQSWSLFGHVPFGGRCSHVCVCVPVCAFVLSCPSVVRERERERARQSARESSTDMQAIVAIGHAAHGWRRPETLRLSARRPTPQELFATSIRQQRRHRGHIARGCLEHSKFMLPETRTQAVYRWPARCRTPAHDGLDIVTFMRQLCADMCDDAACARCVSAGIFAVGSQSLALWRPLPR